MSMTETSHHGSHRTLSAMFDDRASAQRAVDALIAGGVPASAISLTGGDAHADRPYEEQRTGFWDSLADLFFPDDDRYIYAEGLSRGGALVTVRGYDMAHQDMIIDVLDREGSVDLDARESEWRASGWSSPYAATGMAGGAYAATSGTIHDEARTRPDYVDGSPDLPAHASGGVRDAVGSAWDATKDAAHDVARGAQRAAGAVGDAFDHSTDRAADGTVQVVEESLAVGKRDVDHGAVRVRSYVRSEDVSADVTLRSTRIHIERRPVDRPLADGEHVFRDQVIEAREHSEEPVVAKEARVVEEIGLRQDHDERVETVTDTVRKTEVEIVDERTGERTDLHGNRL